MRINLKTMVITSQILGKKLEIFEVLQRERNERTFEHHEGKRTQKKGGEEKKSSPRLSK